MLKYSHRWSIVCQKSIVDKNDNNMSLIGVLEQLSFSIPNNISFEKEFVLPVVFDVVSFWDNDLLTKGDLDYWIEIFSPNKKKIFENKPEFEVDHNKPRTRTILTIGGFKTLPLSGVYKIVVKQKNDVTGKYKKVSEIPLNIKIEKK